MHYDASGGGLSAPDESSTGGGEREEWRDRKGGERGGREVGREGG